MKIIAYILAAIGLMFLGALVRDAFNPHYSDLVSNEPEPVSSSQRARAISSRPPAAVEFIPDSGPGWEVPAALPVAARSNNALHHDGIMPITPSWSQMAMVTLGGLFLMMLALIAALVLKRIFEGDRTHRNDDAAVQELYILGKNLEARMDALETILLERQRPANES